MISNDFFNNRIDNASTILDDNNTNNDENKLAIISDLEDNNNTNNNNNNNNSIPITEMNNLELYLQDLSKVIQWLMDSDNVLIEHGVIGDDVNTVKQQFQVHEVDYFSTFKY